MAMDQAKTAYRDQSREKLPSKRIRSFRFRAKKKNDRLRKESNKWKSRCIEVIYADEGITGTSMEKRNEFHRLIRDCKKGLIDRIIVKSVSRFARNTEELLTALRMLSELGVSVYFEEQGIDTAIMNSEMIITFPGMAAQQESVTISGNIRWSYKKRMESGEFNCQYPCPSCWRYRTYP